MDGGKRRRRWQAGISTSSHEARQATGSKKELTATILLQVGYWR